MATSRLGQDTTVQGHHGARTPVAGLRDATSSSQGGVLHGRGQEDGGGGGQGDSLGHAPAHVGEPEVENDTNAM